MTRREIRPEECDYAIPLGSVLLEYEHEGYLVRIRVEEEEMADEQAMTLYHDLAEGTFLFNKQKREGLL